jgi:hypothetical protein
MNGLLGRILEHTEAWIAGMGTKRSAPRLWPAGSLRAQGRATGFEPAPHDRVAAHRNVRLSYPTERHLMISRMGQQQSDNFLTIRNADLTGLTNPVTVVFAAWVHRHG